MFDTVARTIFGLTGTAEVGGCRARVVSGLVFICGGATTQRPMTIANVSCLQPDDTHPLLSIHRPAQIDILQSKFEYRRCMDAQCFIFKRSEVMNSYEHKPREETLG